MAVSTREPTAQRLLVALVQVLALAVFVSVAAVAPSQQAEWGISTAQAVWLTGTVQLGFVVGAMASTVLNLADRVAPQALMAVSAFAAGGCTVAVAAVDSLVPALALRFLTGACLAGVYPVGMKLTASWSGPRSRGLAMGVMIGALTLGSALPHLIGSLVGGASVLPWRDVLRVAAACALAGGAVALVAVRPGPHVAAGATVLHPRYVVEMFRETGPRRVNLGYFGHMWELYALWTWVPLFVAHAAGSRAPETGDRLLVFATMGGCGLLGCLLGGWAADRWGRAPAAVGALAVSGACCLLSPLAFLAPLPVLAVFCGVWGASVIADSGVFSTALSEVADSRFVGTALSAQTALGFALTVVSIQLVPVLADVAGWQYAFVLLVPGPVLGAVAMARTRGGPRHSAG